MLPVLPLPFWAVPLAVSAGLGRLAAGIAE